MRIILILVFVSLGFITKAQQLQSLGSANTRVIAKGQVQVDSLFVLPNRDTLFTPYKSGSVVFAYGSVFAHTGTKWVQLIDNQKQPWLDTAYVINDSTVRIRRNNLTSDLVIKGGIRPPTPLLGTATNDSTLTLTYNGSPIVVPIKGATGRIDAKVDSVTKSNDSVYSWKAGVKSYSFLVPSAVSSTTTASNQGAGAPVFKQKLGDELQFRSIVPSNSNLVITQNANDLTLNVKSFVDSVRRRTDSVFFYKAGVEAFGFKDSAAAAPAPANVFSSTPLFKTVDTIKLSYSSDGLYIDGSSLSAKAKVVKNFTEMRLAQPDTSLIYIFRRGDNEFRYRYDPSDVTSVDDSATVFRNGSWRFKAILDDVVYPEMFGAVGDGVTNDAASFNAMFRWIEASPNNNKTIKHKHTVYLLNDTIKLPTVITGGNFQRLRIDGTGVTYKKTTGGPLLYRMPSTQTDALNTYIGSYALEITNLKILGNLTAGSVGMKLGAYYTPIIQGCNIEQMDTALVAIFWLNGKILNNHFTSNKSVAIEGRSGEGYWTGGSVSNSAFNINLLSGNRIVNGNGSYAGVYLFAADGVIIRDHISEGLNPRYDIYNESQASSVVNGNTYQNIWFESTGGTNGSNNVCFWLRNNGTTKISGLQNDYADTLLQISNPVASSHMIIENIQYLNIAGKILDAGGTYYGGRTMDVSNCSASFARIFTDTTYWVGGVVGLDVMSSTAGEIKAVNKNITIIPNASGAMSNRYLSVDGGIAPVTDNVNYWGGVASNLRPTRVTVGTGGIRVDAASSFGYGFGSNTANPTEYINRARAGMIALVSTGSTLIGSGTTAQRTTAADGGAVRFNKDSSWFEGADGINWKMFANRQAVRDTAAQIRAAIPAQLNATAGTNMTITGTYPNLTFNATGGGGTSSESLAVINDVDYTIATASGNLSIVYSNVTAARNLTLPAAGTNTGRMIRVRHSGGPFLINLSTGIKINPSTSIIGISQDSEITFMSDGTNWWIVTMH